MSGTKTKMMKKARFLLLAKQRRKIKKILPRILIMLMMIPLEMNMSRLAYIRCVKYSWLSV
jgi:hypothetical protein